MIPAPDPTIVSARIVQPAEVARNAGELAVMDVLILAARMKGGEAHLVQFPDGVVALVHADPRDTAAWHALLAKTHAAALRGDVGPIHVDAKGRP